MAHELFDTCVIFDYLGLNGPAHQQRVSPHVRAVLDGPRTASITPLTPLELLQGKGKGLNKTQMLAAFVMVRALEEAPVTLDAGRQAGEWLAGKTKGECRELTADALIAATASTRGEPVRTINVKHFRQFHNKVLTY